MEGMISLALLIGLPMILLRVVLPAGLVIALQVVLCRRGRGRLGLILPGVSVLLSLLLTLGLGAFSAAGSGTVTTQSISDDGRVVEEVVEEIPAPPVESRQLLAIGGVFLVTNIPTVVLGGIWLYHKNRRDWREELHRMDIQDLN